MMTCLKVHTALMILRVFHTEKILLEIGNRYDNNLQFVVVEIIGRFGLCSLAGYVPVVRNIYNKWGIYTAGALRRLHASHAS